MARQLWRATVFLHRYLGVAVGLLMLVWFASGIVMMYVPYPGLSNSDRLRVASPIAWKNCCALAAQTYSDDQPVRAAELVSMAGEPVLRLRPEGQPPRITSLGPAGPSLEIDENKARDVALDAAPRLFGRTLHPAASETIERDQWTVGEAGAGNRPLYHYIFDDPRGTELYVSSTTGELVLWTTASQRFWNWLGAVPHWLYFTELRKNGPAWAQVIIWTSLVGGFLTVLGLYLGIAQFKRGKSGRLSPYRGWFYWHHIAGLVFGVVTLTWVLSGTVSMNPWGFLEGRGGGERVRLAGEPIAWRDLRASLERIVANPPSGSVVRLESAPLDGKLFWLAARRDGGVERLDAEGRSAPLTADDLHTAARLLAGENGIAAEETMAEDDAYYFDFRSYTSRDALPLPVYRIVLNDSEQTRYYLDPSSGELLRRADANGRAQRWLFSGLHRFDFTAWMRMRPLWDVLVLVLMLGGLAVTGTGVYLAFWRIKRDLTFKRAPPVRTEIGRESA
jgi:hypothetical protein